MDDQRSGAVPSPLGDVRRKFNLRLSLVVALGLVLGAGALVAPSAYGALFGRMKAPVSGTVVSFPNSPGDQRLTLVFGGSKGDSATRVRIKMGLITAARTLSNETTISTITTFTCAAGAAPPCNNFRATVLFSREGAFRPAGSIDALLWRENDVIGFRAEELVNGSWNAIQHFAVGGNPTQLPLVGVADKADATFFPRNANCETELPLEQNKFFCPNPQDDFPRQGALNFLSKKVISLGGAAYYNELPSTERYAGSLNETGFAEFRRRNGFETNVNLCRGFAGAFLADETCAQYRNENDLGWGRQMHCRTVTADSFIGFPTKIACYVTNFRNENDAYDNLNPIATVAMTWFANPRAAGQVQDNVRFYVFDANGRRVDTAALDAGGEKSVPGLCLNCHGGSPNGNRIVGAHFLPFDEAYLPTAAANPDQSSDFRALNKFVAFTESSHFAGQNRTPMTDLIFGWYGNDLSAGTFNKKWRPNGWANRESLYLGVVAPYCRSCHIAQPVFTWDNFALFDAYTPTIKSLVCGTPGRDTMPHAQRTYQRFWEQGGSAMLAAELGGVNLLDICKMKPIATVDR